MPLEIIGSDDIEEVGYGDDEGGGEFDVGDEDLEGLLGGGPRRGYGGRRQLSGQRGGRGRGGGRDWGRSGTPGGRGPMRSPDSRELLIGFVSLAVPGGSSVVVSARPQVLFRPTRLVIPSALAPSFSLDDIKIGNRSQLIAAGPVPGEAFSSTAVNTPLRMDTCQVSMEIILQCANITAGAIDFRAAMFGDAVY
jgi:hypothetical protein